MTDAKNDLSGQTIKGYELRERIGAGGFGEVYRAYQPLVKRDVAVKVVLPQYINNPDFIRRFEAEAQLIANLEHIHIVPLYDFWRDHTGAFLVMRWYRGGSLAGILEKGHWPIQDAARVVDQIASALAVAHRNNVIHRDLKPANILLDDERNFYLADFGIAKDLGHISEYSTMIDAVEDAGNAFIGSPEFISPEQITQAEVSPQSDIYNLGLVLYQLLTGKKPFEGLPLSTLISKHLMEPLPHIHLLRPDLPEELMYVINKATEKDPANRYPDVLSLALDFRKALAHTTPEAISELEQRVTDAFTLEELGLPPDFNLDFEPENPYKGLRAFQEADADDFFGRELLVDSLLDRLRGEGATARFLTLIGPSGSGKSSVIKAGLLPKLRRAAVRSSDQWFFVEMVPGAYPMEELEAALLRVAVNPPASLLQQLNEDSRGLARAVKRVLPESQYQNTQLVLVVDQFEETFTLVQDESRRTHFLNSLAEAIRDPNCPLRVLTTLRADFYDRPLLYPEFGQLLSECGVVVLPLTNEELRRAIVEPAERSGLVLDTGLVSEIVADVGEQPGTLPLLQYALTELFERRDSNRLTQQAYRDIGGVSGALAQRADDIYQDLNPEEHEAARQLFLRLVRLGEGVEDTRRRTLISELLSLQNDDTIQRVLDIFGKYRLLTFDNDPITRTPTVEVAHEALIRQWQRLRQWLDENRDAVRMQRRLAASAEEWGNNDNDVSYLASGTRLRQFEDWMGTSDIALADVEREYYLSSLAQRDREEEQEAARLAREQATERRSRRFLRALAAVLTIATLGALVLSGFAFTQRQSAVENAATATVAQGQAMIQSDNAATQAAIAEDNALEARNLAFISSAQLALTNSNTDLAILLAMQATEDQSTLETRRILAEAAYAPGTRLRLDAHSDRVEAAVFSSDGSMALSGGHDNLVLLTDLRTGAVLQRMEGHEGWVMDVALSPDDRTALSASLDGTLILWDVESGEALRTFTGHEDGVRAVDFNTDGSQAVSGDQDGVLILWDVATGDIITQSQPSGIAILDIAFSTAGFTALTGHPGGAITLWNVQAGTPLLTYGPENGGHSADVWAVEFTPDEMGFVSGSEDRSILLWTFETGAPVLRYDGHNGRVTSLAFSADGKYLVSGSEDSSVILWDTKTSALLHRFIGHTFLVYSVGVAPNGRQILSGSWDGTLRLWDIDDGALLDTFGPVESAHTDAVLSVSMSPDGTLAASASADGSIIVWDTATHEPIRQLSGHDGGVNVVTFSPDGRSLASGGDDNQLIIWDLATGERLYTLEGHSDAIWAADFRPDGAMVASGSRDNTIILWDTQSGEQLTRLFGHTFNVTDVDFSPDGSRLVSSSFDTFAIIWDTTNGRELRRLEGHGDWVWSAEFSPDSRLVITGAVDNAIILWDAQTGQRLRRFEGHTALVYDAVFSPDGKRVLSASADRDIILWDIESGQLVQRFSSHGDAVRSVAFSADGLRFLSGSDDGSVRLWQVQFTLDALMEWLRSNRYLREFTCAERELYDVPPRCPSPTPIQVPGQDV